MSSFNDEKLEAAVDLTIKYLLELQKHHYFLLEMKGESVKDVRKKILFLLHNGERTDIVDLFSLLIEYIAVTTKEELCIVSLCDQLKNLKI